MSRLMLLGLTAFLLLPAVALGFTTSTTANFDGLGPDCDSNIDEGFDQDYDLWTTCEGDCDDLDFSVNPSEGEDTPQRCTDGLDNDCDGFVDAQDFDCDPFQGDDDDAADDDDATGDDDDAANDDDATGDDDDATGDDAGGGGGGRERARGCSVGDAGGAGLFGLLGLGLVALRRRCRLSERTEMSGSRVA